MLVAAERSPRPAISFNTDCQRCPRLAAFLADNRRQYPHYHGRPVASFGPSSPRLLLVGLAPGLHGANATGRPFTGDFAGRLLYATLHRFGFASQPDSRAADDGLRLVDCRITNAVRCVPPQNRPVPAEVRSCNGYLREELDLLRPGGVVLALGAIAHGAVLQAFGLRPAHWRFAHGATHAVRPGTTLVDSYHCSRYNTQTGRLTTAMFTELFDRVRSLVGPPDPA